MQQLRGLDVLFLDALRHEAASHPLHRRPLHRDRRAAGAAADLFHPYLPRSAARPTPKNALPPNIRLAYDGLEILVEDPQ